MACKVNDVKTTEVRSGLYSLVGRIPLQAVIIRKEDGIGYMDYRNKNTVIWKRLTNNRLLRFLLLVALFLACRAQLILI
jgi:hypothetical protein